MQIKKFEDIIAWQKSREFIGIIHKLLKNNKDYYFKDQIFRASISIMNNIAEGYEKRRLNKDGTYLNNEFKRFLYIAKGSSDEVRSLVYVAKDLEYVSNEQFKKLMIRITEISKLIAGFIKTL